MLGALMLIGLPFFFIGGPGYHASRSFQAAWDLGHIFFFSITTSWFLLQFRGKLTTIPPIKLFLILFASVFLLGSLLELLQMLPDGRNPDLGDVLRNQLGCLAAFAVCAGRGRYALSIAVQWPLRITVVVLLAVSGWPLVRAVVDEQYALRQFPVLADFETPFERYRWDNVLRTREESINVRHGAKAMRVQLSTAKYSGIALFHFPENWQGFRTLHCSLFNPLATVLTIHCRIHDTHHKQHDSEFTDRFNLPIKLQPGWNEVVIDLQQVWHAPKNRLMDAQHIEGLGFFVVQLEEPMAIVVDHLYLDH